MARLFAVLAGALLAMRTEAAETLTTPRYFSACPINHTTWSEQA